MDIIGLNTLQPTPPNANRPQGATNESPSAAAGSAAPDTESTQLAASAPVGDGDVQPDPSTPRGSLLDISV